MPKRSARTRFTLGACGRLARSRARQPPASGSRGIRPEFAGRGPLGACPVPSGGHPCAFSLRWVCSVALCCTTATSVTYAGSSLENRESWGGLGDPDTGVYWIAQTGDSDRGMNRGRAVGRQQRGRAGWVRKQSRRAQGGAGGGEQGRTGQRGCWASRGHASSAGARGSAHTSLCAQRMAGHADWPVRPWASAHFRWVPHSWHTGRAQRGC